MDTNVLYKTIIFLLIFYITPGPVWLSVMEATRKLEFTRILYFFLKVFTSVNILIQFSQAVICVVFVNYVSLYFMKVDLFLYIFGGLYITYLAYKALMSKKSNKPFELSFINLFTIMLFSPKMWLLFPSGAVLVNKLSSSVTLNALVFGSGVVIIASIMFFFYVLIGKIGTKLLADKFSYLAAGLLVLFALFLFNEAFNSYFA